ncbi:MAG: hypothetical protein AB1585_16405 [Thermodesulfobacteriota bacterium]
MSLPYYKITCSGCDFQGNYGFYVSYEYQGLPEQCPVLRAAWCRDCDKIVEACTPFTLEEAQKEISENNIWINNNSGFLARFSRSKKEEIIKAKEEIEKIQNRLQYFQAHSFTPRCLVCGSHQVSIFEIPYGEYNVTEELDVIHYCGNRLLISMEGRFSFKNNPRVIFDANGKILLDEQNQ